MLRWGLAIAALSLCCITPLAEATPRGPMPGVFDVAGPDVPLRDSVIEVPGPLPRATASATRYPTGTGDSVAIDVSILCSLLCTAASPPTIAAFLGTLAHGREINLLTAELVTPAEIAARCGAAALACYYPEQNLMVISGNDDTAPDGATREFIVAHEYGHHLANHRRNPPFEPTIDYGTKRWSTYERVCEGARRGIYEPGDEGGGYRRNPGEAFAEAFAFLRFPNSPVQWAWVASLKPTEAALRAIRRDALRPWRRRQRLHPRGHVSGGAVVRRIRTPLDGTLTLRLRAPENADLDMLLRDAGGHRLGASEHPGSAERISFTVCGQSNVRVIVRRSPGRGSRGGRFRILVLRP
jgi:hypothetical protein